MKYGKSDRAKDCGAMDPLCCCGSHSHLASDLDVEVIWYQHLVDVCY